jgi:hypothetical protein
MTTRSIASRDEAQRGSPSLQPCVLGSLSARNRTCKILLDVED